MSSRRCWRRSLRLSCEHRVPSPVRQQPGKHRGMRYQSFLGQGLAALANNERKITARSRGKRFSQDWQYGHDSCYSDSLFSVLMRPTPLWTC